MDIQTKIKRERRKISVAKEVVRRLELQFEGLPKGHPHRRRISSKKRILKNEIRRMENRLKVVESFS